MLVVVLWCCSGACVCQALCAQLVDVASRRVAHGDLSVRGVEQGHGNCAAVSTRSLGPRVGWGGRGVCAGV